MATQAALEIIVYVVVALIIALIIVVPIITTYFALKFRGIKKNIPEKMKGGIKEDGKGSRFRSEGGGTIETITGDKGEEGTEQYNTRSRDEEEVQGRWRV